MDIEKVESEFGFLDGSLVKFVVKNSVGGTLKACKSEAAAKRWIKTHTVLPGIGVVPVKYKTALTQNKD